MRALPLALLALCACAERGPSVVLVSLDTLRADRLGAWGNTDGLTPNLDRFASESTVFTQAYAQANETCFSHASIFSGRYASEIGRLDQDFRLDATTPVLATMLKAYGYHTGGSVAGGFMDPVFGFSRGFDSYDSPVQWASLYHTFPLALRWLDTLDDDAPYFLFVHGYDTHQRYLKPSPYGHAWTDPNYQGPGRDLVRELDGTLRITDGLVWPGMATLEVQSRWDLRFRSAAARERTVLNAATSSKSVTFLNAADEAHVRQIYDGAVAYADAMFGVFMAGLAERGVLDEALVIVIADHGEALGEDGLFNHRFGVGDPETHVPVMVRLPGGAHGGRVVDDLVELVDILPTIAEYTGAVVPASARGRSLLPATRGEPLAPKEAVYTEGAFRMLSIRTKEGRLSWSGLAVDSPYLPAVLAAEPLDGPGFTTSPGMEPAEKAHLRDMLVAWRGTLPPSPDNQAITDPKLKEELRKRGYWGAN
jgi:arylsulfatase A-like enzyme